MYHAAAKQGTDREEAVRKIKQIPVKRAMNKAYEKWKKERG